MPLPYLEKISKKNDIPLLELEKIWEDAKETVNKDPKIKKDSSKYWATVTIVFKNMLKSKFKDISLEDYQMNFNEAMSQISKEDNNTVGDNHFESEMCLIGYMTNHDGLNQADRIIEIEQYVLPAGKEKNSEIRVRKANQIYPRIDLQYYITIKHPVNKNIITVSSEVNEKISNVFFMAFYLLSERWIVKTRYVFRMKDVNIKAFWDNKEEIIKIPFLEYEVDVYHDNDDLSFYNWIKIDIELDEVANYIRYYLKDMKAGIDEVGLYIPTDILPIKPTQVFNSNLPNDEQKKIKDALYKKGIFTNKR